MILTLASLNAPYLAFTKFYRVLTWLLHDVGNFNLAVAHPLVSLIFPSQRGLFCYVLGSNCASQVAKKVARKLMLAEGDHVRRRIRRRKSVPSGRSRSSILVNGCFPELGGCDSDGLLYFPVQI
jgi:hypothetical protein